MGHFLYSLETTHSTHSFRACEVEALMTLWMGKKIARTDPLFKSFKAFIERRNLEAIRHGRDSDADHFQGMLYRL